MTSVLVADDHAIFRQGVRALLENEGFEIVGECENGFEAVRAARELRPEVAVLDLSMPVLNGIDAACEMRSAAPATGTILLTVHAERQHVVAAIEAGVRGYVLKTQAVAELVQAIQAVVRGDSYLSPAISTTVLDAYRTKDAEPEGPLTSRERQLLQLVAEGKTTRQAAELLGVSVKTAETHRTRVMKKLGIHETASLVRYAIRQGLTEL